MSTERKSDLYSLLLLLGSYTFAFLLGELVHEYGHYFAHLAYGSAAIQVHIDPFGGSHIMGVNSLPLITMGITSLAGPLTAIFTSRFASTTETITLSPAFTALVLGAGMFLFQVI